MASSAVLAGGRRPGVIKAVHHSAAKLELCYALLAAGAVLLLLGALALVLALRRPGGAAGPQTS